MSQLSESRSFTTRSPKQTARPTQRFVQSVGTRLALTTALLVFLVASALAFVLISQERREQLRVRRDAATMVTNLFAELSSAPVLFSDDQAIHESLGYLKSNRDVLSAAVFAWTTENAWSPALGAWSAQQRSDALTAPAASDIGAVSLRDDTLDASSWVLDPNGKRIGAVVIRFSLASQNHAFRQLRNTLLQSSLGIAALLTLLLLLLARVHIIRPLRAVHGAVRGLASEAPTADAMAVHKRRLPLQAQDEVGDLARGFMKMAAAIQQREDAIATQNREMRLVLSSVGEGFLVLDAHGAIEGQHSTVLETWFGPVPNGLPLWHYLRPHDGKFAEWLELIWSNIGMADTPLELCLEQLPKSFDTEDQSYEVQYHALRDARGLLDKMVVVIQSVTALRARERAESAQRELVEVFAALMHDRAGFLSFCEEATAFFKQIETNKPERAWLEQLHTLKGNAFLFRLRELGNACELVEEHCALAGRLPVPDDIVFLAHAYQNSIQAILPFIVQEQSNAIQLSHSDYLEVVQALEAGASHPSVLALLTRASREPAERVFSRFAERLQVIARRLNKCPVRVVSEGNGVRFPKQRFAPLWAASVHILRNIADHGLESRWQREENGKPSEATVTLRAAIHGDTLLISFADDGRGVDWDAVRMRAEQRGLPATTRADLSAALFAHGFSTRDESTELSGRGVGLSALHAEAVALGGTTRLDSAPGQGSELTIELPVSSLEG